MIFNHVYIQFITKQIILLTYFSSLFLESANDLETINRLNQELLTLTQQSQQTNLQTFDEIPLKSTEISNEQEKEEIRQLRENLISLTSQLDETNRAWQQYQQNQLDLLRNQLENCLSLNSNSSFDDLVREIVDQVTKEREDFNERYQSLEEINNNLRTGEDNEISINVLCLIFVFRINK